MNGADAIIFAGGVGENASSVRARICDGLQWMGIELDPDRNAEMINGKEGRIDKKGSRVEVWVIPTDEELLIARDTVRVVLGIEHQN
jgi:acetate kinase